METSEPLTVAHAGGTIVTISDLIFEDISLLVESRGRGPTTMAGDSSKRIGGDHTIIII